ncbi:ABC transporter substrate-binding protein [Rhizobium rhizogenes]|uniref:ABC transporter substrate-binding protein n=1 Tax=Rhizobium rhizogenes TaxID=359 RepID=UPI0015737F93|nr:ABC transporter substrate-binding protein [Rhizobium rhizogenes]NTI78528.1 ABC transporter substrate-binding protein [Rhizobium rhizogenes]
MKRIRVRKSILLAFACTISVMTTSLAKAEEIVVAQYGSASGGYPYAIAMAKGWFKEEGANVTGIISSQGGGTTIRNVLAANVPYGEVGPGGVIVANHQGANLIIVSDNVLSVSDLNWVARKDSPINSHADIKGKKIGYTNPRSVTQALALLMLDSLKLTEKDVELVTTGGFGEGLAAVDAGLVDVAPMGEPLWSKLKDKYKLVIKGNDVLPQLDNVVGVTTVEAAKTKGDFIRGVIKARARGVEFMYSNPDEAGDIVAKAYNITPELARETIRNLIAINSNGLNYFGTGQIHLDGMRRAVEVQKRIGAISGDIDLEKIIDTRFLPKDQQAIK